MDIASLGISIDTSDVAKASTDLDKLVDVGEKAEKAADDVTTGFKKTADAADKLAEAEARAAQATADAKARLLETAKTSLQNSEYYQRLTTSVASTAGAMDVSRDSTASLLALQKRMQAESDALVGTTQQQAKAAKEAAAATGVQAEGLQALLGKISPALAALQKLDDQQELLNKHRAEGNIGEDDFKTFSASIDAARQKVKGLGDETSKFSLNTKGARENVLQLGNALAEGNFRVAAHNLLEIGTSAGASALRIAAIAAPLALVAAGVIGLAVAYEKGAAESDEYNKQLILTGNYAGTSAGQLANVARQVSTTVGTTGAAAAALAQLAGSGKIASGSFQEITEAALEMEKATGKSVESTIAEFVKIADDPVAAAKSLNDQYHFLTASVYSQIVALKEQGDSIGATKLLTDTYAETVSTRAGEITKNLGLIERGWNAIKGAAAGALDATLNVGREQTLEQQIAILQKRINTPSSYDAIPIIGEDNPDLTKTGSTKEQDQSRLNFLLLQRDAEASRTKYVGDRVKAEQDSIEAMGKVDALAKSSWTNEQKRVEAVKEYKKWLDDIRKTDPNDSRLSQATVDKNIANINNKFKDPKGPANQLNLTGFNDAQNNLKSITGYYQNLEKELDSAQKAGLVSAESYSSQRVAIVEQEKGDLTAAYEAEIAALQAVRDKSSTTGEQRIQLDQKIADARTSMVKAQKDADSQLEVLANNEKGRIDKQTRSITQYVQALDQQQKALELAGQRAVLGVGRGDRQNALDAQLNSQQDRFAQQALDLANQKSDPSRNMSDEEFAKKSQALADANKKATDQIRQNYADVQTAQGDWTNGATSAWENYLDSAKDVAGQTKSLFGNAFSSMEDAVTNFALTGKLSFADFTKSVISDLARIAARKATAGIFSSALGLVSSAAGSYFGGSATAGSSQSDYTGSAFQDYVAGQRATGGDVAPNSLYQVNELGPELFSQGGKSYLMTGADGGSVTPLGSGGGSVSAGSGGSSPITVSIQISGDGNSQVSSNTSGMEQFGAEIGRFVEARYKQLEAKSLGPQGNIRKAINGRA
jgi:lambda family phage tail tape measure protein